MLLCWGGSDYLLFQAVCVKLVLDSISEYGTRLERGWVVAYKTLSLCEVR